MESDPLFNKVAFSLMATKSSFEFLKNFNNFNISENDESIIVSVIGNDMLPIFIIPLSEALEDGDRAYFRNMVNWCKDLNDTIMATIPQQITG